MCIKNNLSMIIAQILSCTRLSAFQSFLTVHITTNTRYKMALPYFCSCRR